MAKVKFITFVLLQCVNAAMLCAQAGVSGRVSDPDGAAVPGIQIHLEGDGRPVAVTTADTNGTFRFSDISSGQYLLHIGEGSGFADFTKEVVIGSGITTINVSLRLANVAQNVSVVPVPSELSIDGEDNRDQIDTDANLMEPVPVFDQDYVAALIPFLDQTGMATSGVSIVVDGVEMKGTGVSASAIAEARINSDPYSVETSRPGRGRLEIITKPGTPQVHGNLNFTFRDSETDAKNHFAPLRPFEQKRIYEGSITGPAATDHHTTFLVSGSRSEDNLQSVVHALTPSGLVDANVPTPIHGTEFAARIAHDFSSSHRTSLQYNVSDVVTRNQGVGGLVLASAGVDTQSREDDVIFNDRMIISPKLLNQLQLFYEKDRDPVRSVSNAQKIAVDGNFTGGGAQADLYQTENNMKINDTVSWTHGKHYVQFGVNIPNLSRRVWEDSTNRLGTFNFASLSDYTSEGPYSFTQQTGPGRVVFWMNELGAFVQDQIRVRENLQISFGIRYDWQTYFKSIHDFAPRASVAYKDKKHSLVFRAGSGLFYDRTGAQPMADLKRYNGVIIHAITLLNPTYPVPYSQGTDPEIFPANLVKLEAGGRIPYIMNFSAGVERQLNPALSVAATYRGTVGVAMFRSRDVNAPLPPLDMARPDPRFGVLRQIESEGRQIGNALDLTVQGKASQWFSGIAQYTLSLTKNDTGGINWYPANQYSLVGEFARSDVDQRHRLNLLASINKDHWLNLGIAVKLYSGLPYTETAGVDLFNTGLLNARPSGVARNTLQGSRLTQLDLKWGKEIALPYKSGDIQSLIGFDVDAFNVVNSTNYTSFVGNVRSAFFEQPTSAMPPRRLQAGLHFKF